MNDVSMSEINSRHGEQILAKSRTSNGAVSILVHRLGRWPIIEAAQVERLVLGCYLVGQHAWIVQHHEQQIN